MTKTETSRECLFVLLTQYTGKIKVNMEVKRVVSFLCLIFIVLFTCIPVSAVTQTEGCAALGVRHAGDKDYVSSVTAQVGDMLQFQLSIQNITNAEQTLFARIALPDNGIGLEYIKGTAVLSTTSTPKAVSISDDVVLGKLMAKIGQSAASDSVYIQINVKVTDTFTGTETFNVIGQCNVGDASGESTAAVNAMNAITPKVIMSAATRAALIGAVGGALVGAIVGPIIASLLDGTLGKRFRDKRQKRSDKDYQK